MVTLKTPSARPRRWDWVPSAASGLLFAAVGVALLVCRSHFLTVRGRLGLDPSGVRIFSVGAILVALFAASRALVALRRAFRLFRSRSS